MSKKLSKKLDLDRDHDEIELAQIGLNNFEPYLMNRIMARYNDTMGKELHKMGLTTAKMRILAVLSVMNGSVIRDIGVHAVINQSTLSRALDSLERDALILRTLDGEDGRATRIYVTDKGKEYYERIWPRMRQVYGDMFKDISSEDQEQFVETLQKILSNIRKNPI